jgi:phenylacetate-CoA ligase
VIPGGPGNTEQQLELIEHLRPVAYSGTPDFLKILLDAGEKAGRPVASIRKAVVSGAAFPPSLQAEIRDCGIDAYQLYATADLGCIAYETSAREGMVVSEDVLLEIVRPGTGDPVADGEVGEVVVTSFDHHHPWIRLALGDLSAVMPGALALRPHQHPHPRLDGARRPDHQGQGHVRAAGAGGRDRRRHAELGRLRLVVARSGETDTMTLKAESRTDEAALAQAVGETLRSVTKLGGTVELLSPGSLPNDGKVIEDARSYS